MIRRIRNRKRSMVSGTKQDEIGNAELYMCLRGKQPICSESSDKYRSRVQKSSHGHMDDVRSVEVDRNVQHYTYSEKRTKD